MSFFLGNPFIKGGAEQLALSLPKGARRGFYQQGDLYKEGKKGTYMEERDENKLENIFSSQLSSSENKTLDDQLSDEIIESDSDLNRRLKGPLATLPSFKTAGTAVLCFIIFFIATVIFNKYEIGAKLWVSGETVFTGHEYWRLFTALLVHADFIHLLSNAPLFIIF